MKHITIITASAFALALTFGMAGCGQSGEKTELTDTQRQEISERLAPVGKLAIEGEIMAVEEAPVESSASAETGVAVGRSGEDIYNSKCVACHASGAAGAPKLGVSADWKDRLAKGVDALYASAASGLNAMPPKGLCMDCSDEELKAAIDYMLEKVQ